MPLYITDDETAALVDTLADRLNATIQAAATSAVAAQLERLSNASTFEAKLEAFYAGDPLPAPTGDQADKAFFDRLSGESD